MEGRFIDQNTFIEVKTINLETIKKEIPEEFTIDIKIGEFQSPKENGIGKTFKGNWNFSIPVTKTSKYVKMFDLNVTNEKYTIDKVIVSPYAIVVERKIPTEEKIDTLNEMVVKDDRGRNIQDITGIGLDETEETFKYIEKLKPVSEDASSITIEIIDKKIVEKYDEGYASENNLEAENLKVTIPLK